MKYKVLSHEYGIIERYCTTSIFNLQREITVSYYTVGIFRLQDVTNGALLYLIINDNGGALAAKDFVLQEVDDIDKVLIDAFEFNTLYTNHKFFELYRYCYNEFVKEDCKYFKITKQLPYRLLSDSLREQISPEYFYWHIQNVGDCFETDGYRIIFAE